MDRDGLRFRDSGESVYDFIGEMLVECPRCGACAVHRPTDPATRPDLFAPRRLACVECGFTKDWAGNAIARRTQRGVAVDDYFGLPLWLRARCCNDELWAYNEEHLRFIEAFVGAELRERSRDLTRGWSNQSLASRLPAWIKERKNRREVLAAIARLRERIPERPRR